MYIGYIMSIELRVSKYTKVHTHDEKAINRSENLVHDYDRQQIVFHEKSVNFSRKSDYTRKVNMPRS